MLCFASRKTCSYFCAVAPADVGADAMKSQAEDRPGVALPRVVVPSKAQELPGGAVKPEDRPGVAVPHKVVPPKAPGGAVKPEDHPGVAMPHVAMPPKAHEHPGGAAVVNITGVHGHRPSKSHSSVKAQPSLIQGLTLSYHQLTCSVMMGRKCHEWRKQILHRLRY